MNEKVQKVIETVLGETTPKRDERSRILALSKKLEANVVSACRKSGIKAEVRVEGSVAKDTWLSGEPDIDISMRVSPKIQRGSLGGVCLKAARQATKGYEQIERFAEHPYLEAFVEGTRVNIVPCYDAKRGEWLSATDRTPFHTNYIRKHMNRQLRSEVRLLKRFMKGIGVYGAEIKIGGFSGYLCELLILHHGSFANTLKAFSGHKHRAVLDIEGYYRSRENELRLLFPEPLVVVDPVDKGRNVASAVQIQKLHWFVAAARAFLKNPDRRFFYPPQTVALTEKEMRQKLKDRGSAIVAVTFGRVKAVADVLWGQLYRSQRSLRKLVQTSDFNVLRDAAWSDEKSLNVFLFELDQRYISPVKKHLGPPLEREHECDRFVEKHLGSPTTVSGPYVEDGRWIVEIRRKHTDVVDLLSEKLEDGGKNAGVAEKISKIFQKGFRVLVNQEMGQIYKTNGEFAKFLTEFLSARPKWLEPN